jgi:DNA-binding MarR family transcriptional regulator
MTTDPGAIAFPESLAETLRTPFDLVLSDPIRLRLQAALHGLPPEGSMTFTALRKTLQLSDGNLAAHLAILVDAGYADTTVTWRGKRRTTWYAATPAGKAAFDAHVRALEAVIGAAQQRP